MNIFLLRKISQSILTVFVASLIVFIMLKASADPAVLMSPQDATEEQVEAIRVKLGLRGPLYSQYLIYVKAALGLPSREQLLSNSFRFRRPAMELVLAHLYRSLQLSAWGIIIACLVSIPLGMWAASRRGKIADIFVLLTALMGQSTPVFWVAILLSLIFGVKLGILPVIGSGTPLHYVLPVTCISASIMPMIVRITRSSTLEVMQEDYVRTARAKGLSEAIILFKHVLKPASSAIVSVIGLYMGLILSGALVVETVFAWPGLGKLMYEAVLQRDYPVVMAGSLVTAFLVAGLNITLDTVYAVLDPRIRKK